MADAPATAPVSVVITAYNAAPYIQEAITSLVDQTRPPAEIIVVDDGSTDNSGPLALEAGGGLVRVIRQENAGMAAGRNTALDAVSQPFVMFSDADDVSVPNRIELCLDAFAVNPALAGVFANWKNFWIEGLAEEEQAESSAFLKGEQSTRFLCTGLFRSELVRRVGHFSSVSNYAEVLWVSSVEQTGEPLLDLGELTYLRRIHHTNASRNRTTSDLFELIRHLRRKRT
jgi:glycosyltransferase involved in cell wall biosynthesis